MLCRKFNSSNLLCDCQLSWLPKWLRDTGFKDSVFAKCAHPEWLKGKSIFEVPYEQFRCGKLLTVMVLQFKMFFLRC